MLVGSMVRLRSFCPLPASDDDLVTVEVDVFHAQVETLLEPKPAPLPSGSTMSDGTPVSWSNTARTSSGAEHDGHPQGAVCACGT